MAICECPLCEEDINLKGFEKDEVIKCPHCGGELEVVSLDPPVVETPLEDDDSDDWDDDDDLD